MRLGSMGSSPFLKYVPGEKDLKNGVRAFLFTKMMCLKRVCRDTASKTTREKLAMNDPPFDTSTLLSCWII